MAQRAPMERNGSEALFLSGDSLLESLRTLRQQLLPLGEGDGLLASLRPGRPRRWPGGLAQSSDGSSTTRQGVDATAVLGACGALKDTAFADIQAALQSVYTAQQGFIDFDFLGDVNETAACAGQNCAYTNPSSPYGLTILPLAPNETAADKLATQAMPKFAREDLVQRNGLQDGPFSLRASQPVGAGRFNSRPGSALGGGSVASAMQRQGAAAAPSTQQAHMSSWQLLPEEVVLVAGCLPPVNASRYFSWTPYLHAAHSEQGWVTVFASLGDAIGGYVMPDASGALPRRGMRNRLNSSLPGSAAAALNDPPTNRLADLAQSTALLAPFSATGLAAWLQQRAGWPWLARQASPTPPPAEAEPQLPRNASTSPLWAGLQRLPTMLGTSQRQSAPSADAAAETQPTLFSDASLDEDDPFGQFAVVIMTASAPAAQRVQGLLQPVLERLGLAAPTVNVLPISPPFAVEAGLQPLDGYFMLLARNILEADMLPAFRQYITAEPWSVWRLTEQPTAPVVGLGWTRLLGLAFPPAAPPSEAFDPATDGFPPARVVPRAAPSVVQSEAWLQPAMDWLLRRVDERLRAVGDVTDWSVGAGSALGAAGIDWGIDCYTRRIDFCNGDNRDAQYVTSLPLVSLDQMNKVVYLIGINHVATGLATYVNLAPSDPIQRLGLASWDDLEMKGTAKDWMAGGPYAGLSDLLYVVAYARNCTGVPHCKEIALTGSRSLPLARSMLVLLRAYVNPVTGVGPGSSGMVHFRSVEATPAAEARTLDRRLPLSLDTSVMADSQCKIALTSTAVSCYQVLMSLVNPGQPRPQLSALVGRVERVLQGSDCCQAATMWAQNKCWCNKSGQALLNALSPLPLRAMMAGIGRVCGQPVLSSLAVCT